MEKNNIPVIDMQNFPGNDEKVLREALEEWGCFRLVNHSIPISLMSEFKAVVKSLFDLPIEIKQRNTTPLGWSGYGTFKEHEALTMFDVVFPQAVQEFCSQLDVSDYQRKLVIESYSKSVMALSVEIMEKLAAILGVKNYRHSFDDWQMFLKMSKYNFTPETIASDCVGLPSHVDDSFLTILDDDSAGLEILNDKTGEYVAVDPVPGRPLVIFGDFVTAWSNGRFHNVRHRVIGKVTTGRVSINSFLMGPRDGPVEAPAELVSDEHPRLYVPFNWEDYRTRQYASKDPWEGGLVHVLAHPIKS
ncbi:2-oxoglutarate-dependent dioxygenase DAO-like [Tripterygium wilfordii]|uniref:2-oxoglutarate-dependent dioxygenase DAO-like n=1 Tax=Tripterygium wilfordii TaxID=458696 RepID=A0A7J7D9Z1_TRIWF|nr:2-oxoglutarate-dependent dioxygenase DAO-like [Tripterygium wilfordii]KAF5743185.1 2-oxoglutarate-dependent dioxygenase DAO-like [Tripterygium wilfordii]